MYCNIRGKMFFSPARRGITHSTVLSRMATPHQKAPQQFFSLSFAASSMFSVDSSHVNAARRAAPWHLIQATALEKWMKRWRLPCCTVAVQTPQKTLLMSLYVSIKLFAWNRVSCINARRKKDAQLRDGFSCAFSGVKKRGSRPPILAQV